MIAKSQSQIILENSSNIVVDGVPLGASIAFESSSSTRSSKIYPTIGLGASYCVSPNSEIDLSWYRIISKESNLNTIDMLFLGFTFHFGNLASNFE